MSQKSFSVIIPSFNSEKTIGATLDSIIEQNYDNELIQILVVDDGSTDNTKQVVEEKIKKFKGIEYHKKKNAHWGSVINYARKNRLVKNDIVSILDSDDFYTKNCFQIINDKIQQSDLFVGSFRRWDGKKMKIKLYPYYFIFKRKLTNKNQMHSPFCLPLVYFMKKEIFYQLNDIEEGMAFQDPDYSSQIIKNSKSLIFSPKTIGLYYYNREGNSVSQPWNQKRMMSDYIACKKAISNGGQEVVSFRLTCRKFRQELDKAQLKFEIDRKFKFKTIPLLVRWIYWLIHIFACNKYFVYTK
ncbi:MAG: glycosyltransferase family 2 protein [Metamycoplasmataceae bacterium]